MDIFLPYAASSKLPMDVLFLQLVPLCRIIISRDIPYLACQSRDCLKNFQVSEQAVRSLSMVKNINP
jgi:hypothetical protein